MLLSLRILAGKTKLQKVLQPFKKMDVECTRPRVALIFQVASRGVFHVLINGFLRGQWLRSRAVFIDRNAPHKKFSLTPYSMRQRRFRPARQNNR
jgi:hypothetical protein